MFEELFLFEFLVGVIAWALIFGTLCYVWAGKKGLNQINWGAIGAILGIIGVILLWGSKPRESK